MASPAENALRPGDAFAGREIAEESALAASLQAQGHRVRNAADLNPLLEEVGDARYVLLGEASHGTAEYYYTWQAR